jgi:Dienelactone hydrolase family
MTDVTIPTLTHQLRGYLAQPAGEGPWPGVLVLHDAAGMSNDLRHQADWLAGAGYLAVAPDLFSWGRKLACLLATFRDVQEEQHDVVGDGQEPLHQRQPLIQVVLDISSFYPPCASWKSLRAIRISQSAVGTREPNAKYRPIVPAVDGMSIKTPATIPA